jgi:holliday junction DNA helicase RuvA
MISKLKGIIDELKPTELILDVNGVGYGLSVPFSTYENIRDKSEITIYVFTYHKEDGFRLFGFYSEDEKNLFAILLNISGIGPSMALSILSGIKISDLIQAVKEDNPSTLLRIPGIGKSKADKLIFELKRKIKKLENFSVQPAQKSSIRSDAVEALVSLGFDEAKSSVIVDLIISNNPDMPIEGIVKKALKDISVNKY